METYCSLTARLATNWRLANSWGAWGSFDGHLLILTCTRTKLHREPYSIRKERFHEIVFEREQQWLASRYGCGGFWLAIARLVGSLAVCYVTVAIDSNKCWEFIGCAAARIVPSVRGSADRASTIVQWSLQLWDPAEADQVLCGVFYPRAKVLQLNFRLYLSVRLSPFTSTIL